VCGANGQVAMAGLSLRYPYVFLKNLGAITTSRDPLFTLPFKGRAGVGMGCSALHGRSSPATTCSVQPIPSPALPLKGRVNDKSKINFRHREGSIDDELNAYFSREFAGRPQARASPTRSTPVERIADPLPPRRSRPRIGRSMRRMGLRKRGQRICDPLYMGFRRRVTRLRRAPRRRCSTRVRRPRDRADRSAWRRAPGPASVR
jgi:hypothetical protein